VILASRDDVDELKPHLDEKKFSYNPRNNPNDVEELTQTSEQYVIDTYLKMIETNTTFWGGDIEINALSEALDQSIIVIRDEDGFPVQTKPNVISNPNNIIFLFMSMQADIEWA